MGKTKESRILSIAPSWPKGGMGRMSVEYRQSFIERGIPSDFAVLFDRSPHKSWLGLRTESGDQEFSSLEDLLKIIESRNQTNPYRIVHLHSYLNENTDGEIIPQLKQLMPDASFVFTFHGIFTPESIKESDRRRLEHILGAVDDIIYVSENARRANQQGYPSIQGRGHVVTNGTNFFRYENDPEVLRLAEELRKEYSPNGEKVLLWFGRPIEQKGYKELVKAFELMYKADQNLTLVLSMDEKKRAEIEELAPSASQNIKLVGWQKDEQIPAHYKAADMLVFPSHIESFGLVPLEAMAMGTPVALTDAGWSKETFTEPGIAYSFELGNHESIANTLQLALANDAEREALARKAHAYAKEHYNWDRVVDQTLEVYDRLLAPRPLKRQNPSAEAPTLHNPLKFRKQYLGDAEKSLELQLLQDESYSSALQLLGTWNGLGAKSMIEGLRLKYSSPDFELEELMWLDDLVALTQMARTQRIPDTIVLDYRAGKECANKRPAVNHAYFDLIERNYDNKFAWTELGKVVLNAPSLTVVTPGRGEEICVPDSRKAKESLFFFDQALFIDPTFIDAYGTKATALASMGRVVEGLESISKVSSLLIPGEGAKSQDLKGYLDKFKSRLSPSNSEFIDSKKLDGLWSKKGEMDAGEKLRYAQQLLASGIAWDENRGVRIKQALYLLHLTRSSQGISPELESETAYYTAIANQLMGNEGQAKTFLGKSLRANPEHPFAQKRLTDIELEGLIAKAKTEQFDVTYVMPSYNTSRVEARKAIDSVLNQKFNGSIELLFIDDGSAEGATADYIKSMYGEHVNTGQLKVLRAPNQGAGAARNYAIKIFKEGNSKFITFLDADDIAMPDRTQQLVDYLNAHPDKGFVHAKTGFIRNPDTMSEKDARDITRFWHGKWEMWKNEADTLGLPMFRAYKCPVSSITAMATRAVAEKAGYQNVVWKRAQDMMYWASLLRTGTDLGFLDQEVAYNRLR